MLFKTLLMTDTSDTSDINDINAIIKSQSRLKLSLSYEKAFNPVIA